MKNLVKVITVVTAMGISYIVGDAVEKNLKANNATEEEYALAYVNVTAFGFVMGLIARVIIKKIG